jgi:uncharacterized membrane protein
LLQRDDFVSRRLTWVFVLGAALSLAALIASNDQDAIANLLRHDIGSLVLKIAVLVFVGGLVLVFFHERLSLRIARRGRSRNSRIDARPRRRPWP